MAAVKSANTQRFLIDQLQVVDPATTPLLRQRRKYFNKVPQTTRLPILIPKGILALLLFLKVKQQKNEENM